jgi:xylose isomerase
MSIRATQKGLEDMAGAEQRFATRLNSFRGSGSQKISAADAVRAVAGVAGVSAVELNYPQHFAGDGNRSDGPDFAHGAFTHPVAKNRELAIRNACEAVDLAGENNIEHVILWMGPDGYDYPFQANYRALWDLEIEGFRQVAARNPGVRVSVEYKPSDPRRTSLIRSMSDSLLAVQDVGLENFGVTLDFCHSLMAGEQPAAAAAQALRSNKLFGVHLNDGYGLADDGLMVGVVHPWHTLELLAEMRDSDFTGTIYFDTFPDRVDPARECAANVKTVRRMLALLDRVPVADLRAAQAGQDAIRATQLIQDLLFGAGND